MLDFELTAILTINFDKVIILFYYQRQLIASILYISYSQPQVELETVN